MIDLKLLRKKPDYFKTSLKRKGYSPENIDRILEVDKNWRDLKAKVESLKAERNRMTKELLKVPMEEKDKFIEAMKNLSRTIKELGNREKELENELEKLLIEVPNPPHESVPDGESEEDNEILRYVNEKPNFNFKVKDHVELGEKLGWIDIERGVKTSGSRFYYLLRDAVRIEFALINFAYHKLVSKGFVPVVVPIMVRERAMFGTGFFPADEFEIYKIEGEDHYLIGTSEVSIASFHADEILKESMLPLRYAGFSTCLRKEAGAYGKDTRGIFRVHQFDKVEMFSFSHPDKSWEEHEFLLSVEEEIMQELGIPYRVVNICAGELGAPAAKKYDLEAWFPGQGRYREITSCSNCTDFQARRLNIRFRDGRRTKLVHTLNGTAIAIGRTLIAIMENYQKSDGTIEIPEVLKKYILF